MRLSVIFVLIAIPPSLASMPIVVVISVPVSVAAMPVFPVLGLGAFLFVVLSGSFHKHLAPHWIIHHSLICCLLLLLDRKHRITGNLACDVPGTAALSFCNSSNIWRILLDRLVAALDETIQAALAQQVALHLLSDSSDTWASSAWSIVHPVDFVDSLLAARSFLQSFQFLDRAFLSTLF